MTSEKYRDLFQVLPTPYLVLSPDENTFKVNTANVAFLSLFHSSEYLNGKDIKSYLLSICPNTDCSLWIKALHYTIQKKRSSKLVQPLCISDIHKSGLIKKQFNILNTPVYDSNNEVEIIICSLTEETEGVTFIPDDSVLLTGEKFLAEIQNLAKIGSWEVDLITKNISWSDGVKDIYEVEPDYIPAIGKEGKFYRDDESKDKVINAFYGAIKTGGSFDLEVEIITAKGKNRWIRTCGITEMKDGACVRIYGATQDITEKKLTEQALFDSQNTYKSVLQSIEGIVWEADAETHIFSFISDQAKNILGYTAKDIFKKFNLWEDYIHPDDKAAARSFYAKPYSQERRTIDYRMIKADGNVIWMKDIFSVIKDEGKSGRLLGLMVDISSTKRLSELEYLEKAVLELNSQKNSNFEEVLTLYLKGIEALFPNLKCSIMQLKNNRLYQWAAPSLPRFFIYAIEAIPIGLNIGSCGSAAYLKRKVWVNDIQNDLRWAGYQDIALRVNFKSCWSYPLIDSNNQVMATLGIYCEEAREPDSHELKIIERATSLLTVVIENRRNAETLSETLLLRAKGEEIARFGTWLWDIENDSVVWSDSLYSIYGVEKNASASTFEMHESLLHPEDKNKVKQHMEAALQSNKDIEFEERIIWPDGKLRHIKTWAKTIVDTTGAPIKMIGACLDITESKNIQEELSVSEARFRNLVESQTNYVIRIDFDARYTYANKKYMEDFGWLYDSKDIVGQSAEISVLPYHELRLAETTIKCRNSPNRVFEVELDKYALNGSVKATLWHFICLTDSVGEPSEIQCVGIDVTESKQTQDALSQSNERYNYVNMATNDVTYDWDITTDNIDWGNAFYRLLEFEKKDGNFSIKDWALRVHPEDIGEVEKNLLSVLEDPSKNKWVVNYRFRKADDTYITVEEKGYIVRSPAGKAIRMIGVLRDITDRLNHIKAIESQNQKLKEIAWMQSHVVRAPLSRIMGLIQILKDEKTDMSEKMEFLDHLLASADELDDIIKDIAGKTGRVVI